MLPKGFVFRLSSMDIVMKLFNVHDDTCTKDWAFKECSTEGSGELFLGKDWVEVVWIETGISGIPIFRIDIPPSSESVQFGSEMARVESNYHVKMR